MFGWKIANETVYLIYMYIIKHVIPTHLDKGNDKYL